MMFDEKDKEIDELKKQLTTYQILHRDCNVDNLKNISKIEEMENQQKEFINWLEENYKTTQDIWYIKILNKYKELSKISGLPTRMDRLKVSQYRRLSVAKMK